MYYELIFNRNITILYPKSATIVLVYVISGLASSIENLKLQDSRPWRLPKLGIFRARYSGPTAVVNSAT